MQGELLLVGSMPWDTVDEVLSEAGVLGDHVACLPDGEVGAYLGLIHHEDGIVGCRRRMELASRFIDDFGVGAVCGYGREDPAEVAEVLELHRLCGEDLRAAR